jgi:hypothetical protein
MEEGLFEIRKEKGIKMTEKRIEVNLPVVLAVTLKSTAKDLAVIHTQFIRVPQKDEKPELFKELDEKLKTGGKNHIVKLGGVLPVPGLFIRITAVIEEKPGPETPDGYYPPPGQEKKDDDGRGIPEVETRNGGGAPDKGGDPEPGGTHPAGPETPGEQGTNEGGCETRSPEAGKPDSP